MTADIKRTSKRLARHLERQGCRVTRTKSGYRVLCPDGVTTIGWHLSPSDPRWIMNLRASVLRAGLVWPEGMKP